MKIAEKYKFLRFFNEEKRLLKYNISVWKQMRKSM